ncbi:MAG: hypothetical protein C4551_08325 [Bacillota bacterium]|jgi:hypothetical protein|nr:MAG: hypothetical protein C4551_08325 [Bacillota bacterium]
MSVITSYRTRIKLSPQKNVEGRVDPTWLLMEEAVEVTAQELGGRVTGHIVDAFGRQVRCPFALVTPDFPRGVGVKVGPDGDVTFIYDHYDQEGRGYRRIAAETAERIVQNYTALAVAKALADMDYSVEVEETRQEDTRTRAVVVRGTL